MKRRIKQIVLMGVMVVSLMNLSPGRVGALEIIDENGERWTDITEAIKRWPLNTFNVTYISEYDFEENSLSVVFNGVKKDPETSEKIGWQADEILIAWQKYKGVPLLDEFVTLFDNDNPDRYAILYREKFDEPISSGTEVKIDASKMNSNLIDYFYSRQLNFVARNSDGDITNAEYNYYFLCAAQLAEGQVCRLFYRDPTPDGGANSGLVKYFPVQKRGLAVLETGVSDEESSENIDEEHDTVNEPHDIENVDSGDNMSDNDEKYSSGDIFDDTIMIDTGVSGGVAGAYASSSSINEIFAGVDGVLAVEPDEIENKAVEDGSILNEKTKQLIAESDSRLRSDGSNIEVPLLGGVKKGTRYKWLFIPVLGLILVIYWWFIAPIWKKRQKNEKKSKKSVDNI